MGMEEKPMRMIYGVNQADACQAFALGEARERIGQHLRDIDTRMVRLFLYDKGAPDPVTQWPVFVSYVEAARNIGAKPMITFAKMHKPVNDLAAVDEFADSSDYVRIAVWLTRRGESIVAPIFCRTILMLNTGPPA